MPDAFVRRRIRDLVAMVRAGNGASINLRVAWAMLGSVQGDDRWPADTRRELDAINADFETYIGKAELAKSGHGPPPLERELAALLDRVHALELLLPAGERGGGPA